MEKIPASLRVDAGKPVWNTNTNVKAMKVMVLEPDCLG
jgi:hypothetical protein